MPDERKHAKIINFGERWSRPFDRPLDASAVAALGEAQRRLRDTLAIHTLGGKSIEYQMSQRLRLVPAPLVKILPNEGRTHYMHTLPGKIGGSCILCDAEVAIAKPTAWDHLLRDEGLG